MTSTLTVSMTVEVMGCPTVCQHCWAMGRDYSAMPLSDISWILQEVRRFCVAHAFAYDGYPMHEVAAHPQAAHVLRLFHEIRQVDFQPLPTTGVPLATRSDWREILETLRELGAPTLWFAFHGAGAVHDRAVTRQGAYRESLRAVELVREAGMKAGCNLFVTKENVRQFDQLVADLQHAGKQQIIPCLYGFTPNARGRHSEPLRPEWRDVEPLVAKLDAIPETCNWRRFWHELPQQHTESWYVQQALAGTWPNEDREQYEEAHRNMVSLVCRPNLDVFYGFAGQYTNRYGNLRRDGVDEVLSRAMAAGSFSYDEVWFGDMQIPPIEELAARFGDARSQRIHDSFSIRDWWIDRARRAARLHG
ncbi:MAG TPA: radical SAM protein [Ktedonobacteraceae bacterium]